MPERPDWHSSWPEGPRGSRGSGHHRPGLGSAPEGDESICSRNDRYNCCHTPAAAVLTGKHRRKGKVVSRRYRYCPEHMYGRWVEDGFVMHWILAKVGSGA